MTPHEQNKTRADLNPESNESHQIMVAAVQLQAKVGDQSANIAACEQLSLSAIRQGASWIALPEFFNTGMAWEPRIADVIQTEDGSAARFLKEFSTRHNVVIGGSFLCRIETGEVRNRYLAFANGALIGKHDKDLPTMWENAFYEGGSPNDKGILGNYNDIRIGTALCWEFMRTATSRRLRSSIDVIMGGSCWWSIPADVPGFLKRPWETQNVHNVIGSVQDTARLTGVPVIHASHCGEVNCSFLGVPFLQYHGHFEGHAAIVDASGKIITCRKPEEGSGIVCARITTGAIPTDEDIPNTFWLRSRGLVPALAWQYHGWLGKRHYRRHVLITNKNVTKG